MLRSFFIQSEGLVCNLTAGEYVIAVGVWHHAPACIFLRIDSIHHFVMIPFAPSSRFHAACGGFHTRLRRDWDAQPNSHSQMPVLQLIFGRKCAILNAERRWGYEENKNNYNHLHIDSRFALFGSYST